VVKKQRLYHKAYGTFDVNVDLLTEQGVIVYEMEGYIATEQIEPYINDLVEAARTHRPIGMVADPRKMKVLNPDFQARVQSRFWPAIAALGVKKNPAIVPSSTTTQLSVNRMIATVGETITTPDGHSIQIAMLHSLPECLDWIAAN
jgi:hypothetical protein